MGAGVANSLEEEEVKGGREAFIIVASGTGQESELTEVNCQIREVENTHGQ